MEDELEDFILYCQVEKGLTELTCAAYRRIATRCIGHLRSIGVRELHEVRVAHLRRFLVEDARARPAASSRGQTVVAIRQYFSFCTDNEFIDRDPARTLKTPKKSEALPDTLNHQEVARLLAVPAAIGVWERNAPFRVIRDRLLLGMLAFGGMRRSELLALDVDDVDLDAMTFRLRRAKGGSHRTLPIHPALLPLLEAYLHTRIARGFEQPALFLGVQGGRLSCSVMAINFRRYAEAAGVSKFKQVTPHTLRHVFATELLAAGANLRQVQELLGHKHLDSTQRYTRNHAHQLRGAVKRLRWPDRATNAAPDHDA